MQIFHLQQIANSERVYRAAFNNGDPYCNHGDGRYNSPETNPTSERATGPIPHSGNTAATDTYTVLDQLIKDTRNYYRFLRDTESRLGLLW